MDKDQSKDQNLSRHRQIRLKQLYTTFKKILSYSSWKFNGKLHECTITFNKDGELTEITRSGLYYAPIYNLMMEYLFQFSKDGFIIEEIILQNSHPIKVIEVDRVNFDDEL